MWILTGILLGSIITSSHDSEEACRGRMAMLGKVDKIQQLDCRSAGTSYGTTTGTYTLQSCPLQLSSDGRVKCQ